MNAFKTFNINFIKYNFVYYLKNYVLLLLNRFIVISEIYLLYKKLN